MAYIVGIASLLNLLLAFYVLAKNPHKENNRLFALAVSIIGIWVISNIFLFSDQRFEYPWIYLSYALGVFATPFILYWVANLTGYRMNKLFFIFISFATIIIFIFTLIPNYVLRDFFLIPESNFGFSILPGSLFPIYGLFISFILLLALYILVRTRNKSSGLRRIQLNYVLIGFGIPVILIIFLDFILPLLGNTNYANIDSLTSFIFVGVIAYSITRHRFLDIRVVFKKSAIYIISLFFALAIYTYLAIFLKTTIEQLWNISSGWSTLIVVVLVAFGFPPLKNLVEQAINALFKGRKSIDLAVQEVREKIAEKMDVEALINIISGEIKKFLEVEQAKLFILDRREQKFVYREEDGPSQFLELNNDLLRYFEKRHEILVLDEIPHLLEEQGSKLDRELLQKAEKEMRKQRATLAFPMKTEDETFALVLLGERTANQPYTVQDIKFLENLREQVSSVLAYALLYRDAMERIKMQEVT